VPLTNANFRSDVNVNGSTNSSDIGIVKSRSGNLITAADTKQGE